MKAAGIILIVLGVLLMVFNGFNITKEEKILDVGPVEVTKTEKQRIGWPIYAGGATTLVGLLVLLVGVSQGKKKE